MLESYQDILNKADRERVLIKTYKIEIAFYEIVPFGKLDKDSYKVESRIKQIRK